MGLTLLWVWLGVCLVDDTGPFSFIQLIGKWVTDLACVHGLQRSRFLLRPLPSGRASLAVSIVYHLKLVVYIDETTKY
jgi:hypothetical protein